MGTSLDVVVLVALGPWKSSLEFICMSRFSELAKMLMPSPAYTNFVVNCELWIVNCESGGIFAIHNSQFTTKFV